MSRCLFWSVLPLDSVSNLQLRHEFLGHLRVGGVGCRTGRGLGGVGGAAARGGPGGVARAPEGSGRVPTRSHLHHVGALHLHHPSGPAAHTGHIEAHFQVRTK